MEYPLNLTQHSAGLAPCQAAELWTLERADEEIRYTTESMRTPCLCTRPLGLF